MGPRLIAGVGLAALALSSTMLFAQETRAAEAPRPRSVLFYLMDTCRSDRVSFDSYTRKTTPFLEWLAERSVVFESCYSQAPWTKPSMASMLSSRYPSEHGLFRMDQRLPADVVTWPEVLQANGLYTAGFSANIVMGNSLSNFAQGFDHFVEATDINRGDAIRFASGSAKKLNQHAFAWLDESDPWPMLLYMHSVDPHEEYEPEREYLQQFADPEHHAKYREQWQSLLADRPPIPGLYVTQDNFDRTGIDSAAFIKHGSNLYDADILANDDQLKVLWDKLQADGWGEDMVLVITSDHGEEFFDHGGTSHGTSLYDEMIRIPLMIYAPGLVPEGKRIKAPVRSIDIYPTLCELLDIEVPQGLRGESLVPLMVAEHAVADRAVFSQHREDPVLRRIGLGTGVMVSLRSGRWKFILNELSSQLIEKPRTELFDLDVDPHEQINVAGAHPDVAARLEAEIEAFLAGIEPKVDTEVVAAMDPEVIEQLRALGYLGNESEADARPDLWAALESSDPEQILAALAGGADANQLDDEGGISPLSAAAMVGSVELAKLLLEHGADVDGRNRDGATPLIGAAFMGRVEVLNLLLERGADPDAKTLTADTAASVTDTPWNIVEFIGMLLQIPLDRAEVEQGQRECAAVLAALREQEKGSDPGARLFEAIGAGELQAVDESLADGASLEDWEPGIGWTPLSKAAFLGHESIVRRLLAAGASVQTRNQDQALPLHTAALMGRASIVALLIEKGAVVDATDGQASTPLHVAAFLGQADAAAVLLREGADRTLKDVRGQLPIDITRTDWQTTQFVLQLIGVEDDRTRIEQGRLAVAELLKE